MTYQSDRKSKLSERDISIISNTDALILRALSTQGQLKKTRI